MKLTLYNKGDEKETEFGRIPNPPADYSDLEDQLEEVQERFKQRQIHLDDDTRKDLEQELFIIIQDWRDSRAGLENKLYDWNQLFEGVTPQSDFPWPGASQVHIPLPKIKSREIAATINRTTMRPVPFLNTTYAGPQSLYEQSKDFVRELEDFVEDKLKNDTNIHETLKEAISAGAVFRDGTTPVQIMWDTQYEMVTDYKTYEEVQDFTSDYPSADAAGLSAKEYSAIIRMLNAGKKYEAEFEYNACLYDGPKAYLVPLIDLVHWPVWVSKIKDTKVHGKRVWYTDYQLIAKQKSGLFKEEDIEKVLGFSGGELRPERLTPSRDTIEGIQRGSNRDKTKEYQIFELVYTGSLTPKDKANDVVRKHLIYYHWLSRRVLRVESYPIRKGKVSYFPLRFLKRDGRLLGISLLDDISDLSAEVDTIHRQRTNSRTITHVPSFKAKMTAKNTFDPSRREFRFRPGVTFYLSGMDDVNQFDIRPVDLSGSTEDEMLLYQLIDQVTGSSSGLSGQANPIDPRAPARKQQELLRQSTNRIDDYVQNLIPVFEEVGQFVVDLYYQFAPDRLTYYTTDADGAIIEKEIERSKLFNPNIKFKVNGTSVFINPELEYSRMQEIYQIVGTDPSTSGNPRIRRNALERLLMSARVDDDKAFLPNQKEMPQAFTTDEQADRESKEAMNKEKIASKLGDAASKRQHAIDMAQHQADLELRNNIVDSAMNPSSPPEGQPGAGAPAPAMAPGFPVAPVMAGGGMPGGPGAA